MNNVENVGRLQQSVVSPIHEKPISEYKVFIQK